MLISTSWHPYTMPPGACHQAPGQPASWETRSNRRCMAPSALPIPLPNSTASCNMGLVDEVNAVNITRAKAHQVHRRTSSKRRMH